MQPEKTIKKILDTLNHQNGKCQIVARSLADHIEFARLWDEPVTESSDIPFFDIYLIKEGTIYVGAVMEFDKGIYAYLSASYRKKGIMSSALKKVILPHLLQRQPVIRAFIGRSMNERQYTIAKKLAISSGFNMLLEDHTGCRLMMDVTSLKERVFITGINKPLSEERKLFLKNRIGFATDLLSIVQTELEFSCGISAYSEELNDLIRLLEIQVDKLNDA